MTSSTAATTPPPPPPPSPLHRGSRIATLSGSRTNFDPPYISTNMARYTECSRLGWVSRHLQSFSKNVNPENWNHDLISLTDMRPVLLQHSSCAISIINSDFIVEREYKTRPKAKKAKARQERPFGVAAANAYSTPPPCPPSGLLLPPCPSGRRGGRLLFRPPVLPYVCTPYSSFHLLGGVPLELYVVRIPREKSRRLSDSLLTLVKRLFLCF